MVALREAHLSTRVDFAAWRQVTTPHFVLRTDFDEKTAIRGREESEATRDTLISAAWPTQLWRDRALHAIALANRTTSRAPLARWFSACSATVDSDVHHFGRPREVGDGMYRCDRVDLRTRWLISSRRGDAEPAALFAEGLAQFLET